MSHDRSALVESVAAQLRTQLSPLVRRLRGRVSDEIAADLVSAGLIDEGFTAADTESRLFALVSACMRRITSVEKSARAAHEAHAAFE
ncbi:MAG TPA: hypothetical protein VMV18_03450, partial [bacterium]|nr:hypothetical protein [bacterium]